MKTKLAVVGLGLGSLAATFAGTAFAQSGAEPSSAEMRREIAELKQTIRTLEARIEAMERRLELAAPDRGVQFQDRQNLKKRNWPQQDSYLRFPMNVERAMMAPPSFRAGPMDRPDFLTPRSPDAQPRGVFDPGIPSPLDVPKLRP